MDKTKAKRKAENDVPSEFELEEDRPEIPELDSRTTHLCNLVFGIELLRETIIEFVIQDHNELQGLSKQNALSCRLVQKSWLESVFRCLVKSGKSLVNIGLDGRSIESFFKVYDPSSPLTFKLTTWFITENVHWDFEKCLHLCNNGLVELDLRRWSLQCLDDFLIKSIPPMGLLRQKFTLPTLRKLNYSVKYSSILPDTDKKNNGIDIHYVPQSILSGSCNLKYFEFSFDGNLFNDETLPAAAASFGNLLLPGTIEKLVLDCELGIHHLEPFLKINMLSNLTDLTVVMPDVVYRDREWLSPVLNRVCYTLKNLIIDEGAFLCNVTTATIDPPVMKCLQSILIRIVNFEWADGITDLHLKLPALEKLDLQRVRSCSLNKWVDNSKFDLLTHLSIQFCVIRSQAEINFLTIEHAQLMSKAFLNLTKLEISTPCGDSTEKALQCLFQNLTQLQVLNMELRNINGHDVPPRYLDALLLGISCELIDTLKTVCAPGKLWETVQLNLDEQFSLVNLSQLKQLNVHRQESDMSVSDKVEAFVVSKMPNLQKIKLPRLMKISKKDSIDFENWTNL